MVSWYALISESFGIIMAAINPTRRKFEEACEIVNLIKKSGFEAMFNGGCVRDRILNIEPSDFDIASNALPTEIQALFKGSKFKVIDTGIDHGTVTIVGKFSNTEVTTLRKDVDTDGRKAVVQFGNSFEEDSERRDFTINAMYEDLSGNIFDFHGGLADLAAKKLRFVGNPDARIKEDYLRILRLFRFHSRFGFSIDASTVSAVKENSAGLERVSQERITSELWKILEGSFIESALALTIDSEVFSHVFRGFDLPSPTLARDLGNIAHSHLEKHTIAEIRFAYLLSSLKVKTFEARQSEIVKFLKALRLSSRELHTVLGYLDLIRTPKFSTQDQTMEFIDILESRDVPISQLQKVSEALEPLGIEFESLIKCESMFAHLRKAKIPISGSHLMSELKLDPGKLLGETLDHLKKSYRREEWQSSAEGLNIARHYIDQKK